MSKLITRFDLTQRISLNTFLLLLGIVIAGAGFSPAWGQTKASKGNKGTAITVNITDASGSPVDFVRFGLWDHAYDSNGNVINDQAENDNFVGRDSRRFYIKVRNSKANTDPNQIDKVTVEWYTLKADNSDYNRPAESRLTLAETGVNTGDFKSRAIMLVVTQVDYAYPTNTGLSSEPGEPGAGEYNHRTRMGSIDGKVQVRYSSSAGNWLFSTKSIFNRGPDERRRVPVRVVNYMDWDDTGYDHDGISGTAAIGAGNYQFDWADSNGSGGYDLGDRSEPRNPYVTEAYINAHFARAIPRWITAGILIEQGAIKYHPIPLGALDLNDQFPALMNNDQGRTALNNLIGFTPDNTLTLVCLPINPTEAYAYASLAQVFNVNMGERYFIFFRPNVPVNEEVLGHEIFHCLYNRGDVGYLGDEDNPPPPKRFLTFNTVPPSQYGDSPLPDVFNKCRIHGTTIDWGCTYRASASRWPISQGIGSLTQATGNRFVQSY